MWTGRLNIVSDYLLKNTALNTRSYKRLSILLIKEIIYRKQICSLFTHRQAIRDLSDILTLNLQNIKVDDKRQ